MRKADIGLIGLAVMGANLALNMESRGYVVSVFNRSSEKTNALLNGKAAGKNIIGAYSLEELVSGLSSPRKVFLMVKAGSPVDDYINALIPLLDAGDIIIDGGNSYYRDTIRRTEYVERHGLRYIGTGVSGGEEGALKGPAMMPGGTPDAWDEVKDLFRNICAQAPDGKKCCEWIGNDGAGHYVKMVHNGIEYGDMQLICETYHIMRDGMGFSNHRMHEIFRFWNETELNSYLIEITGNILAYKDKDGQYVLDRILDKAGQKGTGTWTGQASLEEGINLNVITEAVYARSLSSYKEERCRAARIFDKSIPAFDGDLEKMTEDLRRALYVCKIISYAQGFDLMKKAAGTYGWNLRYGEIASLWRGGCIIRSIFLDKIREAFEYDPDLDNLITDSYFSAIIRSYIPSCRKVIGYAVSAGIPVPAFCAALSYFDGYTCANLPANLLQAQRDYFGAHTYERIDAAPGQFYHTDWMEPDA